MSIVAIIQARMGSTRLPGKVLKDLNGGTMLERVLNRTRRATMLTNVTVATSTGVSDDPIVAECARLAVTCFRGSENDVLDRYYRAAKSAGAEVVVRITSDCPLIDPTVVDNTIREFGAHRPDYASNTLDRSYPRGLDTEVFTMEGLERCWREATIDYQRTHVTPYFYQHPELFRLLSVQGEVDFSSYRWTVDTTQDLQFIQEIYDRLGPSDEFGWRDVVALLEKEPSLCEINRSISQKDLHEG